MNKSVWGGDGMALRDELLAELERRRGEDVSGQALAERFCVSRSAVWKAVNALRALSLIHI